MVGRRSDQKNHTMGGPTLHEPEVHMLCIYGSVEEILDNMEKKNIPRKLIQRVLNLLIGLSLKGYEGRSIGTIMLIGDIEGVRKHTTQMIINPFKGWNEVNILDPTYQSTFESFSQIDGAMVIDSRGMAHYAGRMIHVRGETECSAAVDGSSVPRKKGSGTRWRAARFITERTRTVALTLSSSGNITAFMNGREVGKLERRVCSFKEGEAPVLVFPPSVNGPSI